MRPQFSALEVEGVTADYLTVSYPLSKGATDVEVTLEFSEDLNTWEPAEGFSEHSRSALGQDRELVTLRAAQPGASGAQYVRLSISAR